jgi:hypothetical protein
MAEASLEPMYIGELQYFIDARLVWRVFNSKGSIVADFVSRNDAELFRSSWEKDAKLERVRAVIDNAQNKGFYGVGYMVGLQEVQEALNG